MNNEQLLAWAAGLFEGEGCIGIVKKKGKSQSVRLQLSSTDRDVLDRFQSVMGFGAIRDASGSPSFQPHWKSKFTWATAQRDHVVWFAENIGPMLCERRSSRLAECMAEVYSL